MVTGTLIASIVVALGASYVSWRYRADGCTEQQTDFRKVAALVWLSLAALYFTALLDPGIYIIRAGILTRLLLMTIALLWVGEVMLGRAKRG